MKTFPILLALATLLATSVSQETPTPTPSGWFSCPESDGYFPHPFDCTKYFVCVRNNAWMLTCPPAPSSVLWYNPEKQVCDYPEAVTCTASPTGKTF
ncbi:peritrophin-1-like [Cloeon dipterum]|uniref:peritrophin-1-like n=1 Tax=Cloeon dipterum TaxID=197152 RepID=UPI0032206A0C